MEVGKLAQIVILGAVCVHLLKELTSCLSLGAKQRPKTFLLEMSIVRKSVS